MRRTHVLKCLVSLMLIVGLLGPPSVTASSSTTVVKLWVGNSTMSIGGVSQPIDAEGTKPVIVEARTLVPIRAIIEAFKGTVAWDATERKVTVTLGKSTLNLWIGKAAASLNGTSLPVDAANPRVMPVIMSGRTMLPVRFVSESLGIDVQYEATSKMITLTYTVDTTPPTPPAPLQDKGPVIWPAWGYDTRNTGQCPYDTSANDGTLKWKYKTLDIITSSPAIASDGTVYVGSYDRNLYALSPNGTLQWKYKTLGAVSCSHAIAPDGTIYLGSEDRNVYAVNPDGTLRWTFRTSGWIGGDPIIGPDGTIYAGSEDHGLYAVNPDGTLKWKFTARNQACPAAIAPDGTIYAGSKDGCLYALNPDGTLKWKYQTHAGITSGTSIASDGTIYVGSSDRYLYAINPDGTLRWNFETGDMIEWPHPAIASDGTIYVGSLDHYLYAINPDGTLRWKFGTDGQIWSSPAISLDGTIYMGSNDHYLYAINPDGTLRWKFGTDGPIRSSPSISSDGTIYFGSDDHYLYALGGK